MSSAFNSAAAGRKYELIPSDKQGLFRVRALRDFGDIKSGEVGGYVAGEGNLSQEGDAWVSHDARVFGNACISEDAQVFNEAVVCGEARVFGRAWVFGTAVLSGRTRVGGTEMVWNGRDKGASPHGSEPRP